MRIILASLILSVLYTGAALAQIYIANQGSNSVSVINCPPPLNTPNHPAATVDVGVNPSALAVTPDGDFVYVTNSGSDNVSIIQTSDNTVVATVDVGSFPFGVAVVQSAYVFVANSSSNNVSKIQTSDNTVVVTVDVGITPIGITSGTRGVPSL